MYGERVETWEKAVEWPLTAAALIFFAAYVVEIFTPPESLASVVADVVIWSTWAVFLIEYLVRLVLAEKKWTWLWRHPLDLAIVVLPMLRPLRLMRFLSIIALVQRGAGSMIRGRVVVYTVGATALIVLIAALAVFDAESERGSFTTFGEALWWSFVTITTVGYGDFTPVTTEGRMVALGLMIGGVALIGTVTATLASWIVERVADAPSASAPATAQQVLELRAEVTELTRLVSALAARDAR